MSDIHDYKMNAVRVALTALKTMVVVGTLIFAMSGIAHAQSVETTVAGPAGDPVFYGSNLSSETTIGSGGSVTVSGDIAEVEAGAG